MSVEETVEREHFFRRPGIASEQRVVELHRPREHPDTYPTEHRRPSRSVDRRHREVVLRPKSITYLCPHYSCPSHPSRSP